MLNQRTLAKVATVTGIGLHSGKKVTLKLFPAEADFGICFKRTDCKNSETLRADVMNVGATENATTLGSGRDGVNTVEHLLAVFYGLGIDNIYCEIDGPEIPIMDGSGASFLYLLKEIGIRSLNRSKKFMVILRPVRVELGDKWAEVSPSSRLMIDSTIVFSHPKIKTQSYHFDFSCENFINDICRARTFGLLKEVDHLKRKGLVKGGSLDNAIVLDDYKVINSDGLRFKNEFVRHKILDTLGDIRLLGYELAGKVTTHKSGHNLHNLLCRKVLETPSAFEIVTSSSLNEEVKDLFNLPLSLWGATDHGL